MSGGKIIARPIMPIETVASGFLFFMIKPYRPRPLPVKHLLLKPLMYSIM